LGVDDDVRAGLVIVHRVVRRVLMIPLDLAGRGIDGERAVGVEIVARAVGGIVFRRRISGAPIGDVGVGIVGAGDVEGAAAGLPGVVLVLPGLAARIAGGGDRIGLPLRVAALGIERHDPIAHPLVAARGADDDRILERERSGVERHVGLIVQVLVPDDLSGLLVGRDDAAVLAGDRDHQIA